MSRKAELSSQWLFQTVPTSGCHQETVFQRFCSVLYPFCFLSFRVQLSALGSLAHLPLPPFYFLCCHRWLWFELLILLPILHPVPGSFEVIGVHYHAFLLWH